MQDTSSSAACLPAHQHPPLNASTSGASQSSSRKRLASAAFTEDSADPMMAFKTTQAVFRPEDLVKLHDKKDEKRLKSVGESLKMTDDKPRSLTEDGKTYVVDHPAESEKEVKELDRAGGGGRGPLGSSFPMTPGSSSESASSTPQTAPVQPFDRLSDATFASGTRHGGIGWVCYGDETKSIRYKMRNEAFAREVDQIVKGDYTAATSEATWIFAEGVKELREHHKSINTGRAEEISAEIASVKARSDTQRRHNDRQAITIKNQAVFLASIRSQLLVKQNRIAELSKNISSSSSATPELSPFAFYDPNNTIVPFIPASFKSTRPPPTDEEIIAATARFVRRSAQKKKKEAKRLDEMLEDEGDVGDEEDEKDGGMPSSNFLSGERKRKLR